MTQSLIGHISQNVLAAIGNTPLIKLKGPSKATGCTILGKAEFMNPGGSIKDRAALAMIEAAEKAGKLKPGATIVEGTAGNTGIGAALVARAKGYHPVIVMPETQSQEKKDAIKLYGADLRFAPGVPYRDERNYVHAGRKLAEDLNAEDPGSAFWLNQFDNTDNRDGHAKTTASEIWQQTNGGVDGFVCAVGSGGSLAGIANGLRAKKSDVKIAIADPYGAALYSYYTNGELVSEGSSVTEGIGQGRITANLEGLAVDHAYRISDSEALKVAYDLISNEGLVLGGSAALNVAGAMALARDLGSGKTIVTLLCDHGSRYQSKLYNPVFLKEKGLPLAPWMS